MPEGFSEGEKFKITAIYLFAFITCIYFLSISKIYVVDQFIQRNQVAKSIVERFELSIPDSVYGIKGRDGRTYSHYGLGWPILAVPFYAIGKIVGGRDPENLLLLLNTLAGAASVTLVFLFSVALGSF